MPHSRPTLMAVRTLSPVTMRVGMCAERNVAIAGAVPGLSLFSKMTKPRNRRSLSTASLPTVCGRQSSVRPLAPRSYAHSPLEPLRLDPGQSRHALAGERNHSEAALGIVGEDLVIVRGYCSSFVSETAPTCECARHSRVDLSQMSIMTSGAPLT